MWTAVSHLQHLIASVTAETNAAAAAQIASRLVVSIPKEKGVHQEVRVRVKVRVWDRFRVRSGSWGADIFSAVKVIHRR